MIFLDTSALYALSDRGDLHHERAKERFGALLDSEEAILTHNYILVESLALVQRRLGWVAAIELTRSVHDFEIVWVDQAVHDEAVRRFRQSTKGDVSLVDHVSFVVMRERAIRVALAFDQDFVEEGFQLYGEDR